ncbi:uncharacterized protein B0H18DRAFT_1051426 [Fomitopsis serialis]|uniref:uncharacterized protein n=1 Tax=Fomitopsis serialis TaxID=139415 RepID=UPI002007D75B|nr:uncharacterized protein B0H18DRAFT_1051426 [Neoantrodia serialis]KAH9912901.1 hypothetical protein B0H18DRAFT_1051426 [Neoantrodia serialis]
MPCIRISESSMRLEIQYLALYHSQAMPGPISLSEDPLRTDQPSRSEGASQPEGTSHQEGTSLPERSARHPRTERTSRSGRERAPRSHGASRPKRAPRPQRTSSTALLERELDALEGRTADEPTSRLEKIGLLFSSYFFTCLFFAGICAVYAGISTYAAWYFLQTNEPYTSNFNIVYAAPLGAAVLSWVFSTTMWVYHKLEALYEKKHGIYEPPREIPEWWTWQRETYVPPPPKLARRYAGYVTATGTISGLLVGGLLGPLLGAMMRRMTLTSAMSASAELWCGAVGTGIVIGGILFALSGTYGIWMWYGGKEGEC